MNLHGNDLFGDEIKIKPVNILSERFEFPPFSILDARQGYWQKRKQAWISQGIQSELGRECAAFNTQNWFEAKGWTGAVKGNTSIFDPVLTELMYKWFCPSGGQIVDPFAGGSVRGIIAGLLGYKYHGIELSARQVDANDTQRQTIAPDTDIKWITGDSAIHLSDAPQADFIFSCPPYGNLEVYSNDPSDLSNMTYPKFIEVYRNIIALSAKRLKQNRFACFVVGEYRDKKTGNYVGFVPDTIRAFKDAGMQLYNEAILILSLIHI